MALFYFLLKHGEQTIPDREGEEFPDVQSARAYADAVAHDLMRNRELATRLWRIEVCDEDLAPCFTVHFSEVDETLGHLPAAWREMIRTVAERAAAFHEAMKEMRATLADSRGTLAKADRVLRSGNAGGHRSARN